MKFNEWYKANKNIININDAYVEVLSCASYKSEDVLLITLMRTENINAVFGDKTIFVIKDYEEDGYKAICFCLY